MTCPVIGITTSRGKNNLGYDSVFVLKQYVDAIIMAGGTPLLIPSTSRCGGEALYSRLDGILFTGGGDISPEYYGGQPHPAVSGVDPDRDDLEITLCQFACGKSPGTSKKPFLGICRGFQIVNVTLGGTLWTHIEAQMPGAIKHDYYPDWPRDYLSHEVSIAVNSTLASILHENQIKVNSLHHQGARETAPGLLPCAYSPDGLVEAVEVIDHPFGFAVQWHPEWLTNQPSSRNLFKAFIDACR